VLYVGGTGGKLLELFDAGADSAVYLPILPTEDVVTVSSGGGKLYVATTLRIRNVTDDVDAHVASASLVATLLSYSPALGKWLFGGLSDGDVWLAEWDGSTLTDLSANVAAQPLTAYHLEGYGWYIGCAGGHVYLYDGTTFTDKTGAYGFTGDVRAITYKPGLGLVMGSGAGEFKIIDPATDSVTDRTADLGFDSIWLLDYNPVSGEVIIVGVKAGSFALYTTTDGATYTDRTAAVGKTVLSVAVDKDTGDMFFGCDDGSVICADYTWGTITDLTDKFGLTEPVAAMCWTPDRFRSNVWIEWGSLLGSRRGPVVDVRGYLDKTLYAFGGRDETDAYVDTNYAVDVRTRGVAAYAALPAARGDHFGDACGGLVYKFGGRDDTVYYDDAHYYDPAANAWTAIASLPDGWMEAPTMTDGAVIFFAQGRRSAEYPTDDGYYYDPDTNAYTSIAAAPVALWVRQGGTPDGARMYAFGGKDDTVFHGDAHYYDAGANAWTTIASYPMTIAGAAVNGSEVSGLVYVAGGYDGSAERSECYCYDPEANSYTALASLPNVFRRPLSNAFIPKGHAWIIAGGSYGGVASTDVILLYIP